MEIVEMVDWPFWASFRIDDSFDRFMTVLHYKKSASTKPYTWKTIIAALLMVCKRWGIF